ncbi:MAG: dihydrodipicolinate synthase family protein [Chloroflexota bacterium]
MDRAAFRGIFPPVMTPLLPDEVPDLASLERLLGFLLEQGVHGLWLLGTTGEFSTLDERERASVLETAVRVAGGRVPVIASICDASTKLAIRHGQAALRAGADAVAVTPPYYYPNSQDELLAHYRAVREGVDLPLFIYNFPQMVKVKLDVKTAVTLAEEGTVIGIKDSQNDLQWYRDVALATRARGLDFRMFAGTRSLIDASILAGGHGAIPSVSNVAPAACVATFNASVAGDYVAAASHQEQVIKWDSLPSVAQGGSANAATFSTMKVILKSWGIIDHDTVSQPLRPLADAERTELLRRVAELPRPALV